LGLTCFPAEAAVTRTEHLQFLVLMIPTFLIIAAGAVSMADLTLPALRPETSATIAGEPVFPTSAVWDDLLAM
jgi:hypothetical protein